MRRLTAWIGGVAGGVAAYRFFRRRPEPVEAPAPPEPDDRAEELRTKLAESRAAEPVVQEAAPEPVVVEEEPEPESPDERRQRVHEEGRAALDEMKSED